jgi:hypothetical protein
MSVEESRELYYRILAEKLSIQAEIENEKLKRIRNESVDRAVVEKLQSLVIVLLRDIQKRYPDDAELRDRVTDFELEWNRLLKL